MVFPQYHCIYVHIPKTAGQSINSLLSPGIPNLTAFPTVVNDTGPRRAHLTAREMKEHDPSEWWDTFFKFTVVRNPWDRALSEYNWRRMRKGARVTFESFEDFLRAALKGWEFELDDARHLMLQKDFILSDTQECLVDFVGRYETLQADLESVAGRVGLTIDDFPVKNRSRSPLESISNQYTRETRHLVETLWGADIEFFGYEFPGDLSASVPGHTFAEPVPPNPSSVSAPHLPNIVHGKPRKRPDRRLAKLESRLEKLVAENKELRRKATEIEEKKGRSISRRVRKWFRKFSS
jgi:chondroitin 4-sulfotransferase 11